MKNKLKIKRQDFTLEQVIKFGLTPEVIKAYNDYFEKHSIEWLKEDLFGECISPIIDIKK